MPWEDVHQRIIERRAQEQRRPRGLVPEDHFPVRAVGENEGVTVRENGLFFDLTGLPIIGVDFRIGG